MLESNQYFKIGNKILFITNKIRIMTLIKSINISLAMDIDKYIYYLDK